MARSLRYRLSCGSLGLALLACSGSSASSAGPGSDVDASSTDGQADGGERPDGQSGAGNDGASDATIIPPGQCNALVNDGSTVQAIQVAQAFPSGTGGTIVPGRYHLTSWEIFTGTNGDTGPLGPPARATLEVTGARLEFVEESVGRSTVDRATSDFGILNNEISFYPKCRTAEHLDDTILSASTPSEMFTATPTSVRFLYVVGQAALGQTFTKEP